jgi:hypothetical protein
MTQPFRVVLIKPSHYDDDGYVIQWRRAFIPSNSLGAVYALVDDVSRRGVLGRPLVIEAMDETHTVVDVQSVVRGIQGAGGEGVVFLVGVQTNQFPRAIDLARTLRAAGIQVAIGGFHVSGCLSMLPELPPDIREALDMGVSIFAGEAERRMEEVLRDAVGGKLRPVYDYLKDLPDLAGAVAPFLPPEVTERYMKKFTSIDAGRGCPFACSFCTIINVQGKKSRHRTPDDVAALVRMNHANGIRRIFITDDNFARNSDWEAILDRLIELRRNEHIAPKFTLQVDTLCHRLPGFIPKAKQAGVNRVFIGLENINPANLKGAQKHQNKITEYRQMLQAWRNEGILTYAGYILGFPADTPESIARDIEIIKRELPIDLLEFFILTPLPGSEDHQRLHRAGIPMDPDMNKYDLEHVTTDHPNMTRAQVQDVYFRAWDLYYTPEHIETLLRRAEASGATAKRAANMIVQFYGSVLFEKVHPLQSGLFRIKRRGSRRSGLERENPFVFYPRRAWEIVSTYIPAGLLWWRCERLRRRIERDPNAREFRDLATTPVPAMPASEHLEMFEVSEEARAVVAKARAVQERSRAAST